MPTYLSSIGSLVGSVTRRPSWLMAGILVLLTATWLTPSAAQACSYDVVFVIDQSGSMRRTDPERRLVSAVEAAVGKLRARDRVGFVGFSGKAREIVPLGPVARVRDGKPLDAIRTLTFDGKHTSIGRGLEQASYQLKEEGRADTVRAIVLFSDGVTDLPGGSEAERREREWIHASLGPDLVKRQVHILGVALSDDADVTLLQRLATDSAGDYVKIKEMSELDAMPRRLTRFLHEACVAGRAEAPPPPAPVAVTAPPQPVSVPASTSSVGPMIWFLAGLVCGVLLMGLFTLIRQHGARPSDEDAARVQAFAPTPKSEEPSQASSAPAGTEKLTPGSCSVCKHNPVEHSCQRCRKGVCDLCVETHRGRAYCPECLEHVGRTDGEYQY